VSVFSSPEEAGQAGRKGKKKKKKVFFLPSSLSFVMSRTLQRAVVPESPTINVTSPSTPHLLTRSGKRPLIKEEEEEDGGESETENENPMKASPSLSFFQESLCSPLAGCRTIR